MKRTRMLGISALAILSLFGVVPKADSQQVRKATKADLDKRKTSAKKQPGYIVGVRDGSVIALFKDRIEFIPLPSGTSFDPGSGFLKRNSQTLRPIHLEPAKIMAFDYSFDVQHAGDHMLVCSNITRPKIQNAGTGDFCGIITLAGEIVYRFPVAQRSPDRLLRVLGINGDGTYAEVFIGRLTPGEDGADINEPREILAWRYPNKLTRFPGPWKDGAPQEPAKASAELIHGFGEREKKR